MKTDISNWKEFVVGDLFPTIVKPAVYHSHELEKCQDGETGMPYVVRSKFNNGIKCRVRDMGNIKYNPAGVISFGAENASFFYQEEKWCSGRDIYYIDTRHLSPDVCLFLIACLQTIANKYEYNYGLFPDLLKKEKIKLPVTDDDIPDWEYMDNYIQQVREKSKFRTGKINHKVAEINLKRWKNYPLSELFNIAHGTRLRKQDMKDGNVNYIGASSFNNGVTAKIGNTENLHPAGVITLCYNGSVGQAFYQTEPFWATDDVNVLYPKFALTENIALFFIPILYKISLVYAFTDKWTAEKMRASEIPLPATDEGKPDWNYMEQYISGLSKKAQNIVSSIA